MTTLTYITTCKGRLSHLRQSLPLAHGQPAVDCIVVDYGCPERSGDWVESNFPGVTVVRSGPTDGFNASTARNLGAAAARTPWLGFFDADVLLDRSFSVAVVPKLKPGNFYRSHHVTSQTWGSIICHSDDFKRIGGYDEAFTGWGGEDDDLIARLKLGGVRPVDFPAALLGEITHSDQLRTRFCDIQDKWVQSEINQLYMRIKLDLQRLRAIQLDRQERIALFDEVKRTLLEAPAQAGAGRTFSVTLPSLKLGTPPVNDISRLSDVQVEMTYTVTLNGHFQHGGIAPSANECI